MKKEDLIKKWLDHNLSSEEQKAFEELNDYEELAQMDSALKNFRAPLFAVDSNYKSLQSGLNSKTQNSWWKPLLRVAAIFAIAFSVYFYTTSLNTETQTKIAEQISIDLPDKSIAKLNANSHLSFNNNSWEENREVHLKGEAFFNVAKGQNFNVITETGVVTVLGTQFNVKQRNNYFEVTCFEGLVAVTHKNNRVELQPGDTFKIIDGKQITTKKEIATKPSWLNGESNFKSVPLKYVIAEFENHYDISITHTNIDTSRLFTGSFTHKDLDLALKSITLPLNLSYSKSGKSIRLKRE